MEVSHEALIREWERLGAWLREAREDIRRQQTISADAATWERRARPADHLYRGSLLLEAEAWAARNTPSAQETAFLAAARTERERQNEEELDRQARQLALAQQAAGAERRAANRLRSLVGVLVLFLLVATALSVFAVRGALQARQAETRAIHNQQSAEAAAHAAAIARVALSDQDLALSASLATAATKLSGRDTDLALLLGVEAERVANTVEARSVLLHNLQVLPPHLSRFLSGATSTVQALAFSPNGSILASGDAGSMVRLWNTAQGRQIGSPLRSGVGTVNSLSFSPDGALLAASGSGNAIVVWRRSGSGTQWTPLGTPLRGPQGQVRVVAFGPHGTLLASSSWDGSIWLWDLSGATPRGTPLTTHAGDAGAMAFSPTGTMLAAGGLNDATIQLWDVAHKRPLGAPLTGPSATVENLVFSPDGAWLAATSDDHQLWLWNLQQHQRTGMPVVSNINPMISPAFSANGTVLALAQGDQTLLWNLTQRQQIESPVSAHTGPVASVAFSPRGMLLATGTTDHTIQLWSLATGSGSAEGGLASTLNGFTSGICPGILTQ